MVAVDTNVIVRFLTHDDPGQASRAVALFQSEPVWLAKTVLLETEWVLRSLYGFTSVQIAEAFKALVGMPTVRLEDSAAVWQAMDLFQRGVDFADAMHLASIGSALNFVSFDERLVKRARRAGVTRVSQL